MRRKRDPTESPFKDTDVYERSGLKDPLDVADYLLDTSGSMSLNTKFALILSMEGASYREAAERCGVCDEYDLAKIAKRAGIDGIHRARRKERQRIIRRVKELEQQAKVEARARRSLEVQEEKLRKEKALRARYLTFAKRIGPPGRLQPESSPSPASSSPSDRPASR